MARTLDAEGPTGSVWQSLGQGRDLVVRKAVNAWNTSFELVDELVHHRFFQSLQDVDWSQYQLGPILIASVLINLLELASPL